MALGPVVMAVAPYRTRNEAFVRAKATNLVKRNDRNPFRL
jgi:hypothetical protein